MLLRGKYKYLLTFLGYAIGVLLTACGARSSSPVEEARGIWLHRFDYCQVTSTHDQDSIRAYIADVIHQAADANFNMLFFQVRGNGDAYYTPGLEPWGNLLTGTLGEDPGWDPLEFALELSHERGLELHAWFNTFPIWRGREPPPLTQPPSPYLSHPEWVVCDSAGIPMPRSDHYVSSSPGVPAAREHIIDVVTDVVRRYDIDGVHFDYIRYPEGAPDSGYSHDAISVARFQSPQGNPLQLDWQDWQREQLTQFVSHAYNAIMREKSWLKVSASVIGSYSASGWNAYHVVYQDPRRWTELGKMDFISPMIYWPRTHTTQPFMVRSVEWQDLYTLERYVFPGIGSYRYNTEEKPYTWTEAEGQIRDLRNNQIRGMLFFDARSLSTRWHQLAETLFSTPANPPPMPWKDTQPPQPPSRLRTTVTDEFLTISWVTPDDDDVQHFNIYIARKLPINTHDSRNLRLVTPGPRLEWSMVFDPQDKGSYLAVSALDRAWNESGLSEPVRIE
ncbi:glycoside hydrolase family 10 protein [Candidatus Neomarinimicrobiota bacterium]